MKLLLASWPQFKADRASPCPPVGFELGHLTYLPDVHTQRSLKCMNQLCTSHSGRHSGVVTTSRDQLTQACPKSQTEGPGYRVKDGSCWPKAVFFLKVIFKH